MLEHPAHSLLWGLLSMPLPGELPDRFGGFTIQVDQVAWGHVARKRTWLYVVGVDRTATELSVRTGGTPTHWVGGFRAFDGDRVKRAAIPPGIKECSKQQRRRTPRAFAEWLVGLARSVDLKSRERAA